MRSLPHLSGDDSIGGICRRAAARRTDGGVRFSSPSGSAAWKLSCEPRG
jgi:hypothetical protein